jgi:hypothetical protein
LIPGGAEDSKVFVEIYEIFFLTMKDGVISRHANSFHFEIMKTKLEMALQIQNIALLRKLVLEMLPLLGKIPDLIFNVESQV